MSMETVLVNVSSASAIEGNSLHDSEPNHGQQSSDDLLLQFADEAVCKLLMIPETKQSLPVSSPERHPSL